MKKDNIDELVRKANSGDKQSLEKVVLQIKDLVYNLSLKMLLFPEDAKDATQEILIRVITHLSSFKYESQFTTWVYRIASNYLITQKGKQAKEFAMSFSEYTELIDSGHSDYVTHASNKGELLLLEEEVKVSCTQGMLLCLSPTDRMVYIIAEILAFNSVEGSRILNISPENFRKKLSRSRSKIRAFLSEKCGLANPQNPCRCHKKIDFLVNEKIIDPSHLRYANLSQRSIDLIDKIGEVERSVAIYRSVPPFEAPEIIYENIKSVLSNV